MADAPFPLVDPTRPETWINYPSPDVSDFQRQLEDHFGYNEHGRPHLRIAWGQDCTHFQRGKERLLYVDSRLPPKETAVHTLKRTVGYEELRAVRALPGGVTDVDSRMVPVWETQSLDEEPKVVPAGWLYEKGVRLEWIGEQLFYVEQWKPAHVCARGDTPESWERQRYEDWVDPEVGMVRRCDIIGPFPHEGRYEAIRIVGEPYDYPYTVGDIEWSPVRQDFVEVRADRIGRHLKFRMPDQETFEALVETEREVETRAHKSLYQMAVERSSRLDNLVSSRRFKRRRDARDAMKEIIAACRGARGEQTTREILGPELAAAHNL